jgi:hypothetical protein
MRSFWSSKFIFVDHALVPVRFIKQPKDSEATLRPAVDAGSWQELNFFLEAVPVDYLKNIAL